MQKIVKRAKSVAELELGTKIKRSCKRFFSQKNKRRIGMDEVQHQCIEAGVEIKDNFSNV